MTTSRSLRSYQLIYTLALIGNSALALGPAAHLSGRVLDQNGEGLPGATVSVSAASDRENVRYTLSDSEGRYSFADLGAGDYSVRARHEGFRTVSLELVRLPPGTAATWEPRLAVAQVGMEDPQPSELVGTLTAGGRVVPGATVCLLQAEGTWRLCTITDPDGRYSLGASPGHYTVTVTGRGIVPLKESIEMVTVGVYRDRIRNVRLDR
jgi:protocatechuate 3,4-dioxygenase beta subunit